MSITNNMINKEIDYDNENLFNSEKSFSHLDKKNKKTWIMISLDSLKTEVNDNFESRKSFKSENIIKTPQKTDKNESDMSASSIQISSNIKDIKMKISEDNVNKGGILSGSQKNLNSLRNKFNSNETENEILNLISIKPADKNQNTKVEKSIVKHNDAKIVDKISIKNINVNQKNKQKQNCVLSKNLNSNSNNFNNNSNNFNSSNNFNISNKLISQKSLRENSVSSIKSKDKGYFEKYNVQNLRYKVYKQETKEMRHKLNHSKKDFLSRTEMDINYKKKLDEQIEEKIRNISPKISQDNVVSCVNNLLVDCIRRDVIKKLPTFEKQKMYQEGRIFKKNDSQNYDNSYEKNINSKNNSENHLSSSNVKSKSNYTSFEEFYTNRLLKNSKREFSQDKVDYMREKYLRERKKEAEDQKEMMSERNMRKITYENYINVGKRLYIQHEVNVKKKEELIQEKKKIEEKQIEKIQNCYYKNKKEVKKSTNKENKNDINKKNEDLGISQIIKDISISVIAKDKSILERKKKNINEVDNLEKNYFKGRKYITKEDLNKVLFIDKANKTNNKTVKIKDVKAKPQNNFIIADFSKKYISSDQAEVYLEKLFNKFEK